jgi:flagellar hook-associated protein 1
MSGLSGTMSVALSALSAEQGALEVTSNNVANVNTPGYSRQRPILEESTPVVLDPLTLGTGVTLARLQSIRDPILQLRIQEETQHQGALNAFVTGMQQAQVRFNSNNGGDIGSQISNFFSSLSQLSTNPTDLALRQGVLTAAGNLANSFHGTANTLTQQRSNVDLQVVQAVQQVNTLTIQIAQVNGQISALQNVGRDASAFVDQRDVIIGQLSNLIDVSQIQSDNTIALTTSNGTALVAGQQAFTLSTQPDVSGVEHVFAQGQDVTSKLTSGELGGLIEVRDQKLPALLTSLDTLAAGLANALNTAHQSGFDLNGDPGGDLFVAPPASGQGAASSLAVAITDPALVAASSDGAPGSNGNVAVLSAVQSQPVIAGQTPTDYYANLVFGVGSDVSNGSAELSSSQLILQQLQDQRGSLSGVSLDEEASNLIQYQRAYDAAARVITTVADMFDTVIHMGT